MRCAKCLNEMASDDAFCIHCGAVRLAPINCRHCGVILRPEAKFCPKCGKPDSAMEDGSTAPVGRTPEFEVFYSLFPNMRAPKATGPADYWASLIIAVVAEIVVGTIFGVLLFEMTGSIVLSSMGLWLLGIFIFFRLFGHKYFGRLMDAGLENNQRLNNISLALAATAFIGGFFAWWLAFIAWAGLFIVAIYVGTAPRVRIEPEVYNKPEQLRSQEPQESGPMEEAALNDRGSPQEWVAKLVAFGCHVRSVGENEWEVVSPAGVTHYARSSIALQSLLRQNSRPKSPPSTTP